MMRNSQLKMDKFICLQSWWKRNIISYPTPQTDVAASVGDEESGQSPLNKEYRHQRKKSDLCENV